MPDAPALVLHVVPTAVARGAQREARALADRLDEPGVRHHRVVSLFAGPRAIAVDVALDHPAGRQVAVGFDPRLALRLWRTLGRLAPDVVVAHGGDALKYVVPALAGRRAALAYYATGTFSGGGGGRLRLWRALCRRPAVVACEGPEVLDECRDVLGVSPARLVLAVNGRDAAEFRPAPAGGRPADAPMVLFVGALTTGKGPDRFVEAVRSLRAAGRPLQAAVCGDGPLLDELRRPAAAAGVELLGARQDVAEQLRKADLLLFPSLPTGEGMPGILIEAGLTGVPVVASAVPGTAMIVDDGVTGTVVPPGDVAALTRAAAELLDDAERRRRMGAAARRHCAEHFSLDTVAATWLSFLQPLVDRSRRHRPG